MLKVINDSIVTVADLIAALEKIEDKTLRITVVGEAGGDEWHSPENFDRKIRSIIVETFENFKGSVELEI